MCRLFFTCRRPVIARVTNMYGQFSQLSKMTSLNAVCEHVPLTESVCWSLWQHRLNWWSMHCSSLPGILFVTGSLFAQACKAHTCGEVTEVMAPHPMLPKQAECVSWLCEFVCHGFPGLCVVNLHLVCVEQTVMSLLVTQMCKAMTHTHTFSQMMTASVPHVWRPY